MIKEDKSVKTYRGRKSYSRNKKKIKPNPFFVIVCEGTVTEKDYFSSFPYYHSLGKHNSKGQYYSHSAIEIIEGAGQYEKVIKAADRVCISWRKQGKTVLPEEVWCVFDCDNNIGKLKKAVEKVKSRGYNAIYSIQCFELWFVLHFMYLDTPVDKKRYDTIISNKLSMKYYHGKTGMYQYLSQHQEFALKNAETLYEKKKVNNRISDPVTRVNLLVSALNRAYQQLKD